MRKHIGLIPLKTATTKVSKENKGNKTPALEEIIPSDGYGIAILGS